MIQVFERFPRVVIDRQAGVGTEGMLMGLIYDEKKAHLTAILVLEDGSITACDPMFWKLAVVYDVEQDKWIDANEPDRVVEDA